MEIRSWALGLGPLGSLEGRPCDAGDYWNSLLKEPQSCATPTLPGPPLQALCPPEESPGCQEEEEEPGLLKVYPGDSIIEGPEIEVIKASGSQGDRGRG